MSGLHRGVLVGGSVEASCKRLACLPAALLQATFTAARGAPRHPTKPGVTARRCVPILPDLEAWPNKYVVVQFPEDDPKDSRTLAKVCPEWLTLPAAAAAACTLLGAGASRRSAKQLWLTAAVSQCVPAAASTFKLRRVCDRLCLLAGTASHHVWMAVLP